MAAQQVTHPSAELLRAFALGKVNDPIAAALMKHLDSCSACCKQVAEISGDDFLNRLRKERSQSSTPAPAKRMHETAIGPKSPVSPSGAEEREEIANLPPELADNPQYEILRELGRGGMGVVYLAKNKLMDRLEVLKVINRSLLDHAGAVERFLREIRSAAKLRHANVVVAYSALQMSELLVFAMEYVEGQDLASLVKCQGPLPIQHACYFVQQAALGLQHAFEKGMVHRDIKPQNLMLTPQGRVKILDFGLSKLRREDGAGTGLTSNNAYLGTPEYCAPEQATDARTADIRADLYSLGGTLYHLLSGRPPFQEDTAMRAILAHIQKAPQPLTELRPDMPERLWRVVARMLAKEPERRYQKPIEVVQALAPFVKSSAKQDAKSGSAPVAASPEKERLDGAKSRPTKQVLRPATVQAAPKELSASMRATLSLPEALRRFGRKGCVVTVSLSVSLALMLTLMTGILFFNLKDKAPEAAIALKNPSADKVARGFREGEHQRSPMPQPTSQNEAKGNPRAPLPERGIPAFPGGIPVVPLPNLSGLPEARAHMTWAEFNSWYVARTKEGYRIIYVNGYDAGGSPRYAGLAIKDGKNVSWELHTGSLDFMQKKDAELRDKGYRPICVSGYLQGRSPTFSAIWVKNGNAGREKIALDLTQKEYTDKLKLERENGFMPRIVTGYADGAGSYRFTALFVPAAKAIWEEHHDLTEEQYQKVFDQQAKSLGRPMTVTAYPTPAGLRFAVVFVKDGTGWLARHRLSIDQLQIEFNQAAGSGFWPVSITGYMDNGVLRYAIAFVKNK